MKTIGFVMMGAAVAAALNVSSAMAGDPLLSGKELLPSAYLDRMAAIRSGLLDLDNSDTARGLYSTLSNWPPDYKKLRVCFMAGSDAVNAAVAKVAGSWNTTAALSISFDFGKPAKPRRCKAGAKDSQVRVSYNQPGYWSLLGQESVTMARQEEASLNLEDFDKVADVSQLMQGEYKGVITHEFGHALGLMHEHQSPVASCVNEFNWKFIIKYLGGPPNNWDESKVKFNMAPLEGEDLMMTEFDVQSVMLYTFPAKFYLKGEQSSCYISQPNNDISEKDKFTVEYMYPVDAAARVKNAAAARAKFEALVAASAAKGTKAAGINYEKIFFTAPSEAGEGDDE